MGLITVQALPASEEPLPPLPPDIAAVPECDIDPLLPLEEPEPLPDDEPDIAGLVPDEEPEPPPLPLFEAQAASRAATQMAAADVEAGPVRRETKRAMMTSWS